MRSARFRVVALLDEARPGVATVTIRRSRNIVEVRPLRRRRVFALPLADVASWIVRSIIIAEARERLAAKRAARHGSRA